MEEAFAELLEVLQDGICEENSPRLFQAMGKIFAHQQLEIRARHDEQMSVLREILAELSGLRNESNR